MGKREESAFWWLFRRFEKDQTMFAKRFHTEIDEETYNTIMEYIDQCVDWARDRSGDFIPQRRPRFKPTPTPKNDKKQPTKQECE